MDLLKKWLPKEPVTLDDAGDPEPSALEVQQMLEAEDQAISSQGTPTVSPSIPPKIVAPEYPVAALPDLPIGHHVLDDAPVNSKVVVVEAEGQRFAVLATPAGAKRLPLGDPAHKLPEGARIRKVGHNQFISEQLCPQLEREPLETSTALAAIQQFIDHFHAEPVA